MHTGIYSNACLCDIHICVSVCMHTVHVHICNYVWILHVHVYTCTYVQVCNTMYMYMYMCECKILPALVSWVDDSPSWSQTSPIVISDLQAVLFPHLPLSEGDDFSSLLRQKEAKPENSTDTYTMYMCLECTCSNRLMI